MGDKTKHYSYDDLPYPSLCYAQSHPDRLATLAMLLGMTPSPVNQCRVLELGCACGGNLLPMAHELPDSTFVGIDSSIRQIDEAQSAAATLNLQNITFKHMDIVEIGANFGKFDYIIAHGVYSWVPPNVQEKVLEICKQNLSPQGVAYVSYNTFPGWHMLLMVREMMLYHTRGIDDPHQRADEARSLIGFLADSIPATENQAYGAFFGSYKDMRSTQLSGLGLWDDVALLHDELEKINDPIYFYQFAERAARHGLQYLAESDFPKVLPTGFSDEALGYLRRVAKNTIEMEQYMDFLRNRTLRLTLLCHEDVALDRTLRPDRLTGIYVASLARPVVADPDTKTPEVERFQGSDGAVFSTDHPITAAALRYLAEISPQAVSFDVLLSESCSRLKIDTPGPQDVQVLAASLLQAFCYSMQLVELHVYAPSLVVNVTDRPVASHLARFQAQDSHRVANLRHERVELDSLSRLILPYLDGQLDRPALLEILVKFAEEGKVSLQENGERVKDPVRLREMLTQELDRTLQWLARAALLVG